MSISKHLIDLPAGSEEEDFEHFKQGFQEYLADVYAGDQQTKLFSMVSGHTVKVASKPFVYMVLMMADNLVRQLAEATPRTDNLYWQLVAILVSQKYGWGIKQYQKHADGFRERINNPSSGGGTQTVKGRSIKATKKQEEFLKKAEDLQYAAKYQCQFPKEALDRVRHWAMAKMASSRPDEQEVEQLLHLLVSSGSSFTPTTSAPGSTRESATAAADPIAVDPPQQQQARVAKPRKRLPLPPLPVPLLDGLWDWLHRKRNGQKTTAANSSNSSDSSSIDAELYERYWRRFEMELRRANTSIQALLDEYGEYLKRFIQAKNSLPADQSLELDKQQLELNQAAVATLMNLTQDSLWEAGNLNLMVKAFKIVTGVQELSSAGFAETKDKERLGVGQDGFVRCMEAADHQLYAAKSFAVAAKGPDGRSLAFLSADTGMSLAHHRFAAGEVAAQQMASRGTNSLVVPVSGFFVEERRLCSCRILCITVLMPVAGYNLQRAKLELVGTPEFMKLADDSTDASRLLYLQQLLLTLIGWCVLKSVARALTAMHELMLLHRDIKYQNILLQGSYDLDELIPLLQCFIQNDCKLVDLGQVAGARFIAGQMRFSRLGKDAGTEGFRAPECGSNLKDDRTNVDAATAFKEDIFCLGTVLQYLVFLADPQNKNYEGMIPEARADYPLEVNRDDDSSPAILKRRDQMFQLLRDHSAGGYYDPELMDIIAYMTRAKPEDRPSARELLEYKDGLVMRRMNELLELVKQEMPNLGLE